MTRATSAPNTYLFTELLQSRQIQSLSSSQEYGPYLTVLQIFSHGVYTSYTSTPDLPSLSPQQLQKLRQLSLLTLAKDRQLSYSSLIENLGLGTARELEDLVTSSIYAGLVDATLDPAHETVHVHAVAPLRDVAPAAVPALLDSLRAWADRCDAALSNLDARVKTIRAAADARARAQAEWEARVNKLVEDEPVSGQALGSGGGGHGAFGGGQGHGFGGGSGAQVLPARGPGGGQSGFRKGLRSFMKRGSGHMDGGADEEDDEAMDLDEEEEVADKKRTSRRKLLG